MKLPVLLVILSLFTFTLAEEPPVVSQVFVDQDSIAFNIEVTGQDTLRKWYGNVVYTLFDPDSDLCRITMEINKPNAQIKSYWGDTLAFNGQNKKIYFLITSCDQLGYDVKLKVIADDSLPYLGSITGHTVYADGHPAEHTRVMFVAEDYNPVADGPVPDSCIDTTGEDGIYAFYRIPAGGYAIYGLGFINFTRFLRSDIFVIGPDTTNAVDTLLAPGKVLLLSYPSLNYIPDSYVYVPGTVNYETIDSIEFINSRILIDSIPPGLIPGLDFSIVGVDTVIHIVDTFSVFPGETTFVQGY